MEYTKRPVIKSPGLGIATLFIAFVLMMLLLSGGVMLYTYLCGEVSAKAMKVLIVMQDLLVFILPAILAAFVATRLPADFLGLRVKPKLWPTLLAIIVLITSMPAMEVIIEWNQNISFPEALKPLEEALRAMEDEAAGSVNDLAGGTSVMSLITGILLVGVLAGVSEELFFRGAMQNLFFSARMNKHIAIWLVAIIFSLLHGQFFGFVPRILLGAFFGYLIWWTGSVWVPIIVHATNNSLVVISQWLDARSGEVGEVAEAAEAAQEGLLNSGYGVVTVILSLIVTALGLYMLRRASLKAYPPVIQQSDPATPQSEE